MQSLGLDRIGNKRPMVVRPPCDRPDAQSEAVRLLGRSQGVVDRRAICGTLTASRPRTCFLFSGLVMWSREASASAASGDAAGARMVGLGPDYCSLFESSHCAQHDVAMVEARVGPVSAHHCATHGRPLARWRVDAVYPAVRPANRETNRPRSMSLLPGAEHRGDQWPTRTQIEHVCWSRVRAEPRMCGENGNG